MGRIVIGKYLWNKWWMILLAIGLGVWAAFIWTDSRKMIFWSLGWAFLLVLSLVFYLALTAATPSADHKRKRRDRLAHIRSIDEHGTEKKLPDVNTFFWLLLIFLAGFILIGYALRFY